MRRVLLTLAAGGALLQACQAPAPRPATGRRTGGTGRVLEASAGRPEAQGGEGLRSTVHLEELSLEAAVELTLALHPGLDAAGRELAAREAEARGAARPFNPTLGIDVEDVAGSGSRAGIDSAQSTLWLSQRLDLGGERAARRRTAGLQIELADLDRELLARELESRTRRAFWSAHLAAEQLELARSAEQAARRFLEVVSTRVEVGRVSPVEETRYTLILDAASRDRRRAQDALEAARRELTLCLGGDVRVGTLVPPEVELPALPDLDDLREALASGPRGTLLQRRSDLASAAIAEARAARTPNLTVSAGLRHFEQGEDLAAVVGVQLPLPLLDPGSDAVHAARERERGAVLEARGHLLAVERELHDAWARLARAQEELETLDARVLADAAWVSEAVDEGYREGKYELLEVLDAQAALREARERRLDLLQLVHHTRAELGALIGGPLP